MKLFECHGHIAMSGNGYAEDARRHANGPDEALVRAHLAACRDAGVVYYRDGGDIFGASAFAKKTAPEYGIEYVSPVFAIHKNGRYGKLYGRGFDSLAGYEALLDEAERQGADFIKIMVSGIIDFKTGLVTGEPLTGEETAAMTEAAHRRGFSVMAHANGAETVRLAAEAGADSIEHGYFADDAAFAAMAERGAVWTPTNAPMALYNAATPETAKLLGEVLEGQGRAIKRAMKAGVLIASGSDAGARGVRQGAGAQWEQSWLRMLGADTSAANERIKQKFRRF